MGDPLRYSRSAIAPLMMVVDVAAKVNWKNLARVHEPVCRAVHHNAHTG